MKTKSVERQSAKSATNGQAAAMLRPEPPSERTTRDLTGSAASLADFIWRNAEDLWGDFKHTDFGKVILPFTLLRRLECVLEPIRLPSSIRSYRLRRRMRWAWRRWRTTRASKP